jgi:hypothetical protein
MVLQNTWDYLDCNRGGCTFGFIVQHLWNWLIPAIVGWHAINFWQAVGILLLSKILFGGFRGRGECTGGTAWGNDGKKCLPKSAKNSAGACEAVVAIADSNRGAEDRGLQPLERMKWNPLPTRVP